VWQKPLAHTVTGGPTGGPTVTGGPAVLFDGDGTRDPMAIARERTDQQR
jgi:hypothetical protein